MIERLYVGRYEKKDTSLVLGSFGYNSAIYFDGEDYRGAKTPEPLGESDALKYHLGEFLEVLEKKISRGDERPIVLMNVTERLDESEGKFLKGYLRKLKRYGRDIFIFSEKNNLQAELILDVRLTDYSKYNEEDNK